MPYTVDGKNVMTGALAAAVSHLSLHSASPATLANELSGGSPAYARKTTAWNAASGGSVDNSDTPVFDVPAGATVAAVGFCSNGTAGGGTLHGYVAVVAEVYAGQGVYTVTDADLVVNDP